MQSKGHDVPVEYIARKSTDRIMVYIRRNQPDIGLFELDQRQKRLKRRLDSGYHFIIRHSGEIEKARPHNAVGGFFPNCIDVNVILAGDELTTEQQTALAELLKQLQLLYQEATIHYA